MISTFFRFATVELSVVRRLALPLAALSVLVLVAPVPAMAAPTVDCPSLAALRIPHAKIHSAVRVAAGEPLAMWAGGAPQPMPKAFCRVRGTASPVVGSAIGFEVWLPEAQAWNGKFLQAGNGGTAGSVPLFSLLDGVTRGYATAATDSGHLWPDGLDYGWASGRPEAVVDFGWRAVEQTTRVAKRVIKAGFGAAPRRAYFMGCSDGGRDAMMAAQRLPDEFDGIVAGAPALAWIDLMTGQSFLQRDFSIPTPVLPVSKLPMIQAAALAACGKGGAYVADPQSCRFDPAALACKGEDTPECLTPRQVEMVRSVYHGLRDPSTGRTLPGLMPGAEAEPGNWDFWILNKPTNPMGGNGAPPTSIGESFFRHLVRNDPSFKLVDLTDADVTTARQRWSADLDAMQTDLRPFLQRGGKLLHYHGWADSAVPPDMSVAYFTAVQQRIGPTADAYRLFMVPGMNHCAGGKGPWQTDWLAALERWVERGEAPREIVMQNPANAERQALKHYEIH